MKLEVGKIFSLQSLDTPKSSWQLKKESLSNSA